MNENISGTSAGHDADHEKIRRVLELVLPVDIGEYDGTIAGHFDHHNRIHKVINLLTCWNRDLRWDRDDLES
jgi:hypothetical protein